MADISVETIKNKMTSMMMISLVTNNSCNFPAQFPDVLKGEVTTKHAKVN